MTYAEHMARRLWCWLFGHPGGNFPTTHRGLVLYHCTNCKSLVAWTELRGAR